MATVFGGDMIVRVGSKRWILVALFMTLLTVRDPTSAQTTIGIIVGVNRVRDVPEYYWWKRFDPVGYNFAARVEVAQTEWLSLTGGLGLLWFPLRSDSHVGYNLADRLPPSNGGHGFHQLRYSIGLTVNWPRRHSLVVPFFCFGGALISEYVGAISVKWPNYPGYLLEPTQNIYWVYNIGIGFDVNLPANLFLGPSARYESNGTDRMYLLYTIQLGYRFDI